MQLSFPGLDRGIQEIKELDSRLRGNDDLILQKSVRDSTLAADLSSPKAIPTK